jgi:hypothetical protein
MDFLHKRITSEYDENLNLLVEFCPKKIIDKLTLRLIFFSSCLIFENEVCRNVKYPNVSLSVKTGYGPSSQRRFTVKVPNVLPSAASRLAKD